MNLFWLLFAAALLCLDRITTGSSASESSEDMSSAASLDSESDAPWKGIKLASGRLEPLCDDMSLEVMVLFELDDLPFSENVLESSQALISVSAADI